MQTLADWLEWIERTHTSEIELGLDRVTEVARRLNIKPVDGNGLIQAENNTPIAASGQLAMATAENIAENIVVVAGTNGKGTTVSVLEQLLCDAGRTVGVYTSPHFHHYNERFRINQHEVEDQQLIAALEVVEAARAETPLTYFEFSTLAALQLFSAQPLDVVILEVGLGGRLDAVNIVPADIAVVTRIDLDHQGWLGDTRELIGAEKAGVLRDQIQLVCSDREPTESIHAAARKNRAAAYFLGLDFDISKAADTPAESEANTNTRDKKQRAGTRDLGLSWRSIAGETLNLPPSNLHPDSIAAALTVAELLSLPLQACSVGNSLAQLRLAGRMQSFKLDSASVLVDVAHNPAAVEHLRSVLIEQRPQRCLAVFAVMADKEWRSMVDIINDVIDDWFLAELPGNQRAERAVNVAEHLQSDQTGLTVNIHPDPAQALAAARKAVPCRMAEQIDSRTAQPADSRSTELADTLIIVFGSFFTVAPALDYLHSVSAVEDTRQNGPGFDG